MPRDHHHVLVLGRAWAVVEIWEEVVVQIRVQPEPPSQIAASLLAPA